MVILSSQQSIEHIIFKNKQLSHLTMADMMIIYEIASNTNLWSRTVIGGMHQNRLYSK